VSLNVPAAGQVSDDVLLKALSQLVRDQIKKELMKDIEPIVEKAVVGACECLKIQLEARKNDLSRELIIRVTSEFIR
jgi:hypothetical protein